MGQAFRRAAGKVRAPAPASPSPASKTAVDRNLPKNSTGIEEVSAARDLGASADSDGTSERNFENVLEEKDSQYDAMLSQMAGRIRAKPGGKPEMGEAFVVEKYKRPLPKLRNTKPESSNYEERLTEAGTVNIAQLRQIVLLREGKSDEHDGPMDIEQIAQRFRVDVAEVQRALQFVSLPPEYDKSKKNGSNI